VAAPGNRNESPLLREALPEVMRISREVGLDLQATGCGFLKAVEFGCKPPWS
jgi:hypothetical protein